MGRIKMPMFEDGCWLWTGARSLAGYGQLFRHGRVEYAHRLSHEQFKGPIPSGHDIDHLCRNRWCCNPQHLEAVPHIENMRRSPIAGKNLLELVGERHRSAKLTRQLVKEIRARWEEGQVTQKQLGLDYGVSPQSIRLVVMRNSWKHVE